MENVSDLGGNEEPPTFVREHECRGGSSEVILSIHQDPDGLWRGGNGATVWDSALVLSAYLEQNPALLKGKRVLEIGAGDPTLFINSICHHVRVLRVLDR